MCLSMCICAPMMCASYGTEVLFCEKDLRCIRIHYTTMIMRDQEHVTEVLLCVVHVFQVRKSPLRLDFHI